ncbi:MAG: hypothetical protein HUU15_19870, partial [Candidatus Brocadiae bacterium]|nr:hypothetical protein [Candidatus Brocadiia bacterium]
GAAAGRRAAPAGEAILAELTRGTFRIGDAKTSRDAFGRGQVDTWRVDRLAEYVDTTGSGAIDWVRVDDFGEGRWTRSFVLLDGRWQPSNILDVFLEIEFKLPWARDAYHPHDVEVQLNGTTVARMEDSLPEGFYRFQLRPQDLRLPTGAGSVNQVRLVTTHLRGGHYVVTTNFNLVFQLAIVQRWVIADSPEDADRILRASGKFTSGGRDAALYANEWAPVGAPPEAGKPVVLRGLVRNLGGEAIPGGKLVVRSGTTEIASVPLPAVGPADLSPAEVTVTLPAGVHALTVTAEIEGDGRRANDAVPVVVRCGGDAKKPELAVTEPAEGARAPGGNLRLAGTAKDDTALARIELSVNGGLWQAVTAAERWEATVAIQKGPNRIRVRAVDGSGNATEVVRVVDGE